jgi:hypothetical protein
MSIDVFNNVSNDYIQPDLAPCPGSGGDDFYFEFLSGKSVGVIDGNKTLASLSFSDFSQIVAGWSQDKKYIQAGEVIYIPGLTKGVYSKSQSFPFYFTTDASSIYYMKVDASISFYRNFRYSTYNLTATADFESSADISSVVNIALENLGASVTFTYDDVSTFTFGGSAGYDFSITNMNVVRTDTSINYELTEDEELATPAFKYPNGGMLGYMLKTLYPTTAEAESDRWLYMNHVPSTLTFYEASTGDAGSYVQYTKTVDVGMNGSSTSTTMSAGDYLYYIDINNLWDKVGSMRSWISAPDSTTSYTSNLLTGFYLYNPHEFPVQVDYILLNYES